MTGNSKSGSDVPVDSCTTMQMLENDPEAVYRRLRQKSPIVRIQAIGRIVFTRADDVLRVKTDTEFFGSHDVNTPMQRAFGGHTLMRKDGCEHLRERHAMEASFSPTHVRKHWKIRFDELTENLLQNLEPEEAVDLLPALAEPLSAGYLKIVLGIEDVTDTQLFKWACALIKGAMNTSNDPFVFEASDQANIEMNDCFDRMIERHLLKPNTSVLSMMVNQSEPIELSQVRTNLKICIGGAVIESRDALLSTLFGLLSEPSQLQYCIESNAWDKACEEGLRWVAPIQASPRIVKKSLIMRGLCIPEGETVMAIQASANHDERVYKFPHRFNVQRRELTNQTFGNGPHNCLGAGTYRLLISEIVLPKLFARYPRLCLAKNASTDFNGFAFRGPTSLIVSLK